MDDPFDPYHRWLGIPPDAQPADHYQLLGIGQHEDDGDVIASAADRQMAHIRTFQSGKRSAISQKVLNELSAAKLCLLDDERRAEYDEKLRTTPRESTAVKPVAASPARKPSPALAKRPPTEKPPVGSTKGQAIAGSQAAAWPAVSTAPRRGTKRKSSLGLVVGIGGLVTGGVVLLIAFLAFKSEAPPEVAERDPELSVAEKTERQVSDGLNRKRSDRGETVKTAPSSVKKEGVKKNDTKQNDTKQEDTKQEAVKQNDVKQEDVKQEDVKKPAPAKVRPADAPKTAEKIDWKTFSLVKPAPDDEAADAPPLPAAKVLSAQRARVLRIFEPEITAARDDPGERSNLAKKLIAQAEQAEDEPPLQYSLLIQARDVTVDMAKPAVFLPIIDWMADVYQIDAFEEKLKAITRAIGSTTDRKALGTLADAALAVHQQADERQLYDVALRFAKSARTATRKAKDSKAVREVTATIGRAEKKQQEHRKAERALAVLIDRADDPEATGAMGRYLAFTMEDWSRGLPLLAKSPDATLAKLAKQDLARSTPSASSDNDTSILVTLADAWLALAKREGKAGDMHPQIARRARYWYEKALPDQKGIERIKVRKQLDEIDEALGTTASSADSP